MIKSLNRLIGLAATTIFFAILPTKVSAATFSYYASSLFSQSGAYASSQWGSDDPGPDADWDATSVQSDQTAMVFGPSVMVQTEGSGTGDVTLSGSDLIIEVEGSVNGMSTDPTGHMESYSGTSTVQAAVTTGIYFQIDPEVGESIGDPVRIDFDWHGDLDTSSGTAAHIDGGFAGDTIAITLNDYPAPTSFDPAKAVWTRAGSSAQDGLGDDLWQEDGFFMAAIGDVIGIHMGAGADLNLDGNGLAGADASQMLELTASPVPVPGAIWLLGPGLLGLWAVRRGK